MDLEAPLTDLRLPKGRLGQPYRSLLAVGRLDGDPLGVAAVSVEPGGGVSGDRLAEALRRQLEAELREAFARRGLALPRSLPASGIPGLPDRGREAPAGSLSVSVVVATCGDPLALERCLSSILACDYGDFEVIVVENRPASAATRRMLSERFADETRVRYVEEARPGGSQARNTGLALADGEVVAFTDDDVIVDRAWILRCARAFERAEDVACATGLILPLELETDSQLFLEQFAGFGKGFRPLTYRLTEAREADPLFPYTPGRVGSGANTAVHAKVARQVGGFDTTLGPGTPACGAEDLDLYRRFLREGNAIAYEPSAIVWHEHPEGMARLRRQVYRYGVGLSAMFGKQLVAGPERLQLLRAVPAGVRYAREPTSQKNARKPADYPRRLDWLERLGMLVGPFAYLLSALVAASRRLPGFRGRAAAAAKTPCVGRLVLSTGKTIEMVSFRARDPAPPPAPASGWAVTAGPGAGRTSAGSALTGPIPRAMVTAATAACVAAPLAVALDLPAPLRLATVLALMCLAPGAALIAALRGRLEAGLVIGVSLASTLVIAQSMLWLGAWWPKTFLYALSGACLPPLVAELRTERRQRDLSAAATASWPTRLTSITELVLRTPRWVVAHAALLTAALVAWGTSLSDADLTRIDGFGLLSAMPLRYFLAIALLLGGFIGAVSRPVVPRKLLAFYVVALILVVHATTPLLYNEPRYVWTFRHIGVINLIAQTGTVNRDIDIYNNWPAFFALNAWFRTVAGVSPGSYAEWAQVFFNVVNVLALRFALRGVTRDERLIWTATWLFVLANFVGQDYLAPQAFAFPLSLIVVGLCLRCAPHARPQRTRPGEWWERRMQRLRGRLVSDADRDESVPAPPLSAGGALIAGGLCSLAVILSHQLSPIMLLLAVGALSLIARRIPLWIPIAMGVVEAWWLSLAWPFVTRHFAVFDPNLEASARPAHGEGLPGLTFVTDALWVGAALMVALAGVGLVRRLRAGRWDLRAAALIVGPLLVLGVQSYGGEGRIRVYLFVLPWLCFFAAAACAPVVRTRLSRGVRSWRLALASAAVGTCLLLAYFGGEYTNRISSDDVDAATWFERHAPRHSSLISVMGPFPYRLTARYPLVYANSAKLTNDEGYRGRRIGRTDLPRMERELRGFKRPRFLVLSPSQQHYGRLYGLVSPGSLQSLDRALSRSAAFRLVYRRGRSTIYEDIRPERTASVFKAAATGRESSASSPSEKPRLRAKD